MSSLFDYSCTWNQLLSLNITRTQISHAELHRKVESGCLSSLQELQIFQYPLQLFHIKWPNLRILRIERPTDLVLSNLADSVEQDSFPELRSVCLKFIIPDLAPDLHSFSAFQRLTGAKIFCHKFTGNKGKPTLLESKKCACQLLYHQVD